jgi:hypothetical protein
LAFALYLFEVRAKPRQSRPLAFALYLFEVRAKPRQSRNLEEVFLPLGRNEGEGNLEEVFLPLREERRGPWLSPSGKARRVRPKASGKARRKAKILEFRFLNKIILLLNSMFLNSFRLVVFGLGLF